MVLNRRLEYGFNGYQVPAMPRAARSPRRRGSIKKKWEDSNMCAFDLLAAVAGKLLVGKDGSSLSSSNLSTKQESFDQGSCVKGSVDSHNTSSKEITDTVNKKLTGSVLEGNMTSDGSTGLDSDKLMKEEAVVAGFLEQDKSESGDFKVKDEPKVKKNVMGMYSLGDPVIWDAKPLAQIKSDSATELSLKETKEHRGNNVELVDNRDDDDEKSSGCTHRSSTSTKSYRSAPCVGDRRIRKVLTSKYWKVAKKWKDNNFTKDEVDLKTDDKECYKNVPSERNFPFKKRKFFDLNTESNSIGEVTGDGSANWASSSIQNLPCQSSNPHVRFRIGSFKVPELVIEIPETATVGSLKRAVMEAVTSVLGGELRVGILLQGKKVGDDSKTLLQTGISHDKETDVLGFTLEPSSSSSQDHKLPSVSPMATPYRLNLSASQSNLFRSEAREGGINLGNSVESDRVSATSPADVSNRSTSKVVSKAIVPVSGLKREALSVVPIRRKPKQSEMAQRRVRRPFSVAEVEALVQAVEKLGTGRWRDVKLRAFDSAKHRTYVDLKDKWKTLVHTARISPQQRRGEPVPQELLDRVLTAHAYWSQHQAKQHLKHHHPHTCLLL